MNVLLIIAQSANMVYAIRNRYKGVGVVLLGCLIISIAFILAIYIWSWNYTVKALTVGFE
jgi:ABC-type multidrug transport system permease subunit